MSEDKITIEVENCWQCPEHYVGFLSEPNECDLYYQLSDNKKDCLFRQMVFIKTVQKEKK